MRTVERPTGIEDSLGAAPGATLPPEIGLDHELYPNKTTRESQRNVPCPVYGCVTCENACKQCCPTYEHKYEVLAGLRPKLVDDLKNTKGCNQSS